MRDVPDCMRSRDCFLLTAVVSAACQAGRGDICGAAVWVQVNIGLQVVPVDMPLLKMWGPSSKCVWHLGITPADMMGHILSPEELAEPFGSPLAAPLSWSEPPRTGSVPPGWRGTDALSVCHSWRVME